MTCMSTFEWMITKMFYASLFTVIPNFRKWRGSFVYWDPGVWQAPARLVEKWNSLVVKSWTCSRTWEPGLERCSLLALHFNPSSKDKRASLWGEALTLPTHKCVMLCHNSWKISILPGSFTVTVKASHRHKIGCHIVTPCLADYFVNQSHRFYLVSVLLVLCWFKVRSQSSHIIRVRLNYAYWDTNRQVVTIIVAFILFYETIFSYPCHLW